MSPGGVSDDPVLSGLEPAKGKEVKKAFQWPLSMSRASHEERRDLGSFVSVDLAKVEVGL